MVEPSVSYPQPFPPTYYLCRWLKPSVTRSSCCHPTSKTNLRPFKCNQYCAGNHHYMIYGFVLKTCTCARLCLTQRNWKRCAPGNSNGNEKPFDESLTVQAYIIFKWLTRDQLHPGCSSPCLTPTSFEGLPPGMVEKFAAARTPQEKLMPWLFFFRWGDYDMNPIGWRSQV